MLPADPEVPGKYPAGLVPTNLLCPDCVEDAHAPGPPLAFGEPCLARLKTDPGEPLSGCSWSATSILGFHPTSGKVAFLDTDEKDDERGDCRSFVGVIAPLDKPLDARATPIAMSKELCPPTGSVAPWGPSEFVARLAKEGYVDPLPLVKKTGRAMYSVWGYRPVAILRAPLSNYLLHASEGASKINIDLVEKNNKTRHRLGSTPLKTPSCTEVNGAGKCVKSTTSRAPSILEAALSPDRKYMVVLLQLNTFAPHDTLSTVVRTVFPMPAKALPPAPGDGKEPRPQR